MNILSEWGWVKPSEFIWLEAKEKALLAAMLSHIGKQREKLMKK